MAKKKTAFFCKECGYESSKWLGQCPACKTWDAFVEEPIAKTTVAGTTIRKKVAEPPKTLQEVSTETDERITTKIEELDRVLGGGIVIGSLVLVGGDPGIGKSTLLLQMCKSLADQQKKVLYISGEESLKQIKLRAQRLGDQWDNLLALSETNLEIIEATIESVNPQVVIIDSIQTMFKEDVAASPGSVSQVREATSSLLRIAKGLNIAIFIVGHVTKEGVVAGPRMLEHMVDTVLYFEGENSANYRMLRAVKNRFGSTNEMGVFEMRDTGLVQVENPSEFMLQGMPEGEPGSVVAACASGTRPILVEVQALICQTNFNMARRTAAGTDFNRVNLLMAVLEKRLGVQMANCDAYVNVAGGMKIVEPALDLALIIAILSSYRNKPFSNKVIAFGEIGLTGEVRAVNLAEQRVMEAQKLGFEVCILPLVNKKNIRTSSMRLIGIRNIKELTNYF